MKQEKNNQITDVQIILGSNESALGQAATGENGAEPHQCILISNNSKH